MSETRPYGPALAGDDVVRMLADLDTETLAREIAPALQTDRPQKESLLDAWNSLPEPVRGAALAAASRALLWVIGELGNRIRKVKGGPEMPTSAADVPPTYVPLPDGVYVNVQNDQLLLTLSRKTVYMRYRLADGLHINHHADLPGGLVVAVDAAAAGLLACVFVPSAPESGEQSAE